MRFNSARVRLFRNVIDSTLLKVDPEVTCLVGKNESGKTALLRALYLINPVHDDKFDLSKEYPRWRLSKDRKAGGLDDVVPVEATFTVEAADQQAVEAVFGPGVLTGKVLTVQVSYNGSVSAGVGVVSRKGLDNLFDDIGTPKILRDRFEEANGLGDVKKIADEIEIEAEPSHDPADLDAIRTASAERLASGNTRSSVIALLRGRLPKFFYFSDYQFLPGRINIDELAGSDTPAESGLQTARALLRLAATDAATITDDDFEDRKAELEAVSNELTSEVLEYWKQNEELSVEIDIDKQTVATSNGRTAVARFLDVRVKDRRHGFTNNFDQRSSGFRWFFSFLAAFSEFEHYQHGVVVLLDEPALTLHGRAQADFLRYIDERLADSAQVLFTTHSPFMVDASKMHRIRIVEDRGPVEGSVVSDEVLSVAHDSLFPLQAALGYDIAQNLFVGPDNLLVEGTSDFTYLTLMSDHLKSLGREGLDERWRILPAGGATNIPAFVALIGRNLDVTAFIDGTPSGVTKLENLSSRGLLAKKRILLVDQFSGVTNSDIEDLFAPKDYMALYNKAFGVSVTQASLTGSDRIIARISRSTGTQFKDHGRPADYLLRNQATVLPKFGDKTLDAFEAAIVAINSTLS